MDEPEILTATEASRSFSEMLHRVCYGGESFLIKKGHRIMARIVPVEVEIPQAREEAPEPISEQSPEPAASAAPAASSLFESIAVSAAAQSASVTDDEAEYFKTVLEQLRKPILEDA